MTSSGADSGRAVSVAGAGVGVGVGVGTIAVGVGVDAVGVASGITGVGVDVGGVADAPQAERNATRSAASQSEVRRTVPTAADMVSGKRRARRSVTSRPNTVEPTRTAGA